MTAVPLHAVKEGTEFTTVFNNVLFPLISQLLKPEVYQTDPNGMGETRVQAAGLLCRVFLTYLQKVGPEDLGLDESRKAGDAPLPEGAAEKFPPNSLISIWTRLLSVMERLMTSSGGDHVEEAIPESLKNILLIMSTDGYLETPEKNPKHKDLWIETWRRLDRFLPNLFGELFPEEAAKGPPWKPQSPSHGKKPSVEEKEEKKAEQKVEQKEEVETKEDDVD